MNPFSIYPDPTLPYVLTTQEVEDVLRHVEQFRAPRALLSGNLTHVGPYPFELVRIAIAECAKALTIPLCQANTTAWRAAKLLSDGKREAVLWAFIDTEEALPEVVRLEVPTVTLGETADLIYEFNIFPQPRFVDFSHFADHRLASKRSISFAHTQEHGMLSDVLFLWEGLRWLCRNLRTWRTSEIILPEDLKANRPTRMFHPYDKKGPPATPLAHPCEFREKR